MLYEVTYDNQTNDYTFSLKKQAYIETTEIRKAIDEDGNKIEVSIPVKEYIGAPVRISVAPGDFDIVESFVPELLERFREIWTDKIISDYKSKIAEYEADLYPPVTVQAAKAAKKAEIGKACSAVIYAGIEVDGKHYSLTEHDQIELMGQHSAVKDGAVFVPYHADGELCRMFSADEFIAVATAATAHIFYHRTYCNHLNAWINRAGTVWELNGVTYGAELPGDLAANMAAVLVAAQGGAAGE